MAGVDRGLKDAQYVFEAALKDLAPNAKGDVNLKELT
jgi:hypothetical protein